MARVRQRGASGGKKDIFGGDSELAKLMADTKKRMGDATIGTGQTLLANSSTYVETGIFLLDFALLGGFQESRANMTYGWEGAGKTTVVMRAIAAAQRKHPDKAAFWVDAEGTFDQAWAAKHGVDVERLVYAQPETGEEAVDLIEAAIRAKETCIVALDSIPAIVPQKMIERSAEDPTMAVRASLMGVCCSKIIAGLGAERKRGHNPTVMLVNQWRRKVGFTMGDNRILPGGDQVRFMNSVMVEIKKKKGHTEKDRYENESTNYNEHAFDVDKLKGASSITQGEFKMVIGEDYSMQHADADMPDIRLPSGAVDDYKVVLAYGKRMGFFVGGGQSWQIDNIPHKFKRIGEAVTFLVENPKEFLILKRKMIALKRKEANLSPVPMDGYLLGKA